MKKHINALTGITVLILTALALAGCATNSVFGYKNSDMNRIIVDISALESLSDTPVTVPLEAGSYTVTVIGTAEGGEYDAWKAWVHFETQNLDGTWRWGWYNTYTVRSEELPEMEYGDHIIYGTAANALENAENTMFTLTEDADVDFFITDNPTFDNSGGISLSIERIDS